MNNMRINTAINDYYKFVLSCREQPYLWRLTTNSEITPFALVFAVFSLHLIKKTDSVFKNKEKLSGKIIENVQTLLLKKN